MVEFPLAPAMSATLVPAIVKFGVTVGLVTIIGTTVAAVDLDEVPVTVTEYVPAVVVASVVNVNVAVVAPEVIAAGCVTEHAGAPAAPAGAEVIAQLSATAPVKPLLGVTVMVDVAVAPWLMAAGEVLLSTNEPDAVLRFSTYAALSTWLVPIVGLIAIALIVSVALTAIGVVYLVEAPVGVVPSVV